MKKSKKSIYIIEIIILIFITIFKIFIKEHYLAIANYINIIFWTILLLVLITLHGFPKNKNYLKSSTNKIVIIILLLYFLISYLVGIATGFARTFYAHDILSIIKNIAPIILLDIVLELNRYLILKREPTIQQKIILTILYIILNIVMIINNTITTSNEQLFLFASVLLLPIIAREFLYTYMTDNVGYTPSIIYRIFIDTYVLIVPIVPSLGNYLSSVLGILLPYIIYKQLKKNIAYKEKGYVYTKKYFKNFVVSASSIVAIIIFALVSGFFKYQMIAIATNSMQQVISRGDAVIFEKKQAEEIKLNDILVFKYDNTIITHRVIEINKNNGKYSFITKGDNNDTVDNFELTNENVIGIVKMVIKYIGYPTLWFNE